MRSYSTGSLNEKYPHFGPLKAMKKYKPSLENSNQSSYNDSDDDLEDENVKWTEQDEKDYENKVISYVISRLSSTYHFVGILHQSSNKVYEVIHQGQKRVLKINFLEENECPKEIIIMEKLKGVKNVQELLQWHIIDVYQYKIKCSAILTPYYKEGDYSTLFKNVSLIRNFMYQVFEVLIEMHKRGIIYRDLKISNIVWNEQTHQITIIDYDCSTILKEEKDFRVVGTDCYMAPEIKSGKYNEKVDIWSAGVLLGQLLYGINENDLKQKHINNWLKNLKLKKDNLNDKEDLLKKCLEQNSSDRRSSLELLNHSFFSC